MYRYKANISGFFKSENLLPKKISLLRFDFLDFKMLKKNVRTLSAVALPHV